MSNITTAIKAIKQKPIRLKIPKTKTDIKIGDKIRITENPITWSSALGKSPENLEYPNTFIVKQIENVDSHVALGTEEGYGFSLLILIDKKIIEII